MERIQPALLDPATTTGPATGANFGRQHYGSDRRRGIRRLLLEHDDHEKDAGGGIMAAGNHSANRSRWMLILLTGALLLLGGGCRTPQPSIASDETFFTPLTAAPQRIETAVLSDAQLHVGGRVDSLLKSQREQERRIRVLAEQVDSLGASRRGGRSDSVVTAARSVKAVSPAPAAVVKVNKTVVDAERLYASGEYSKTILLCQELIKQGLAKRGDRSRCNFVMGASYYRLKQFEPAIAPLKRVLESKVTSKRADATFLLGLTYKQLGRLDDASSMYEAALKESPPDALVPSIHRELDRLKKKR
jgi:TolA-binding protein